MEQRATVALIRSDSFYHFPAKTAQKELLKIHFFEWILENLENLLRFLSLFGFVWNGLAKCGIMPDSGKQKDYVHLGIIIYAAHAHINCVFCPSSKNCKSKRKLAENMVKKRKEIKVKP